MTARRRLAQVTSVLGAVGAVAATVAAVVSSTGDDLTGTDAMAAPATATALGAYVGPAGRGAAALPDWEQWAGKASSYALDFAAADSWQNVTGPTWMLDPWRDSGRRLVYSVPLFPHRPEDTAAAKGPALSECAAGEYDSHWETLGSNLVASRLATTIVRPGWEFDGDWYVWAAHGREADYVQCFRRLVDAMRTVPGQDFEFLWNPALGRRAFPAEVAYPGDSHVDYVGVDVYDVSWSPRTYPVPAGASADERRAVAEIVWGEILDGDHGLRFWSRFAAERGKRMALPEWGLSRRPDGHGGGDNPLFVKGLFDFLGDPRNNVAFAFYFDVDTAQRDEHRLSGADSPFPAARELFRRRVAELPA